MKTIALLFPLLLAACGSAAELEKTCARPDGVYLVTMTKIEGTCGEGFTTPEPIEFHGWSARLHAVSCSDAPTPFTEDRCDHAEWNLTCPNPTTTFSGEIHCTGSSCDVLEGTERILEAGACEGTMKLRGVRLSWP